MSISSNLQAARVAKKGSPLVTGLMTGGSAGVILIFITNVITMISMLLISDISTSNQVTGFGLLVAIVLSYVALQQAKKFVIAKGFPSPSRMGNLIGFALGVVVGSIVIFFISMILGMLIAIGITIL
jgi:hypothetical protein